MLQVVTSLELQKPHRVDRTVYFGFGRRALVFEGVSSPQVANPARRKTQDAKGRERWLAKVYGCSQ